ncbi:MAG TPA: hypothetical protein VEJ63_05725 [Planctomycetota bacterium]|nr:hypothetical protein [Planctomycetota bacterium]
MVKQTVRVRLPPYEFCKPEDLPRENALAVIAAMLRSQARSKYIIECQRRWFAPWTPAEGHVEMALLVLKHCGLAPDQWIHRQPNERLAFMELACQREAKERGEAEAPIIKPEMIAAEAQRNYDEGLNCPEGFGPKFHQDMLGIAKTLKIDDAVQRKNFAGANGDDSLKSRWLQVFTERGYFRHEGAGAGSTYFVVRLFE